MVKLNKSRYIDIFDLYKNHDSIFPLIGSVLLNEQDGVIFVDDLNNIQAAYVEHAFGFAQIFGLRSIEFELDLEQYLLIDQQFEAHKIRLFTPCQPCFLGGPKRVSLRSYRQHFTIYYDRLSPGRLTKLVCDEDIETVAVDKKNILEVDSIFQVVGRFWRSPEDFINKAMATVVLYRGQMASICYSAAEFDRQVEIDVLTLPEFRNLGLGKLSVNLFIEKCRENSLQPLWDCFTNNKGSMQLAKSLGFKPINTQYAFYTISK